MILALVLGVWTLALKPEVTHAHTGQVCDVVGEGWGEIDGEEVHVYSITGIAYC